MVTGAEITLGIQALKAAFNIAKDAKDLTDTTAIRGKVIEMQSLIMEAQASAIDAREGHAAQVQRIHDLEEEVARLKAWGTERENYELRPVATGAFAYVPKAEVQASEEIHRYCANCFDDGQKSLLQQVTKSHGRAVVASCHRCGSEIYMHGTWEPEHEGKKSKPRG